MESFLKSFYITAKPEKKEEVKKEETKPKEQVKPKEVKKEPLTFFQQIINFLKSIIYNIIFFLIIFVIGVMVLYSCKIAQTGVLPLNDQIFPYVDGKCNKYDRIPVNINTFTDEDGIDYSQKLYVDNYEKNVDSKFFKFYRGINSSDPGFNGYLLTVLKKIILINFMFEDFIWNFFNKNLYESVIIFIIPFILPFITIILLLVNFFYFFYSLIFSAGIFQDSYKYYYYFVVFCLFFLFLILSFTTPLLQLINLFVLLYVIFQPILTNASKQMSDKDDDNYTFSKFLKDTITYKSNILMYLLTFIIIYSSLVSLESYLCAVSIVVVIIVFMLFYFKILPGKIYEKVIPDINVSPVSSYDKYEINCESTGGGIITNIGNMVKLPSLGTVFKTGAKVGFTALKAAPSVIRGVRNITNAVAPAAAPAPAPAKPSMFSFSGNKNNEAVAPAVAPAAGPAAKTGMFNLFNKSAQTPTSAPTVVQGTIVSSSGPGASAGTIVSTTAQTQGPGASVGTTVSTSAAVQGQNVNNTNKINIQTGGARNLKNLTQNINKINRIFENQ